MSVNQNKDVHNTRYISKGGFSNAPLRYPLSTSCLIKLSTMSGLRKADWRFLHSTVGKFVFDTIVSKRFLIPSKIYCTKCLSGCFNNYSAKLSTLIWEADALSVGSFLHARCFILILFAKISFFTCFQSMTFALALETGVTKFTVFSFTRSVIKIVT